MIFTSFFYYFQMILDESLVLLGLEADPRNFVISFKNMWHEQKHEENLKNVQKRVFVLPVGVSNETVMADFKRSIDPACGSILESKPNAWWCAQTAEHVAVPVVRLDKLLSLVPPEYELFYLKIDVEGATTRVLQGAGKYLKLFRLVSMELQNDPLKVNRFGESMRNETVDFMATLGFTHFDCEEFECSFAKSNSNNELKKLQRLHNIAHYKFEGSCDIHGMDFEKGVDNI